MLGPERSGGPGVALGRGEHLVGPGREIRVLQRRLGKLRATTRVHLEDLGQQVFARRRVADHPVERQGEEVAFVFDAKQCRMEKRTLFLVHRA